MTHLPTKRKHDSDEGISSQHCIVHVPGLRYSAMQNCSACNDPQKKFAKLKEIKALRLGQPPSSSYRIKGTCDLIPEETDETHGFH